MSDIQKSHAMQQSVANMLDIGITFTLNRIHLPMLRMSLFLNELINEQKFLVIFGS